jgi:hypothetical protein
MSELREYLCTTQGCYEGNLCQSCKQKLSGFFQPNPGVMVVAVPKEPSLAMLRAMYEETEKIVPGETWEQECARWYRAAISVWCSP